MVPTPTSDELRLAEIYVRVQRLQHTLAGDIGPVLDALDQYTADAGQSLVRIHGLAEYLNPEDNA